MAVRKRIRTAVELTRHRAAGHLPFSPDCPDCRRSIGTSRPRCRMADRRGGEISVDIAGPLEEGVWPTDRPNAKVGRYFLVGAFIPFSAREAAEQQAVE